MSDTDTPVNGNESVDCSIEPTETIELSSDVTEEARNEGNFSNFALSKRTKKLLNANGIDYLFPVQARTFQSILDNKHLIVKSSTGSGKTFAFLIPLVERFLKDSDESLASSKVLILAPTRELAIQIADCLPKVSNKFKAIAIYGGVRIEQQLERLEVDDPKFLVCTPGRLLDVIENHRSDLLRDAKFVVLDECDRMLDMGFLPDVSKILSGLYPEGGDNLPQTLIFSATIPKEVRKVIKRFVPLSQFEVVDLVEEKAVKTSESVEHLAMEVVGRNRADVIARILQVYCGSHKQAIIFCATKREADTLSTCSEINLDAHVLHGDIPQDKREMIMKSFRKGKYRVLVTTDVAARGLDIPEVDLVVVCGPPQNTDDYIHRSGRTGRAGRAGTCILLFTGSQIGELKMLEQRIGVTFKRVVPPNGDKILAASADDALKSLNAVPEEVRVQFLDKVEAVLSSMDAKDALAAALAKISGYDKVRSGKVGLLSGVEDKTTYVMTVLYPMHGCGVLFSKIRSIVGDQVNLDHAFGKILFAKDGKNVYFELDSEFDDAIQGSWKDTAAMQMSLASDVPDGLVSIRELRVLIDGDTGERKFNNWDKGNGGFSRGNGGFNRGGRGGGRGSPFRGRGEGRRGRFGGRAGFNGSDRKRFQDGGFGGNNSHQNGTNDANRPNKVIKLEDGGSD